ncbi:integrase (plasmid) [Tardibacter chloracetimidivorans]|uniref:Integrase n=2 Tax=Sphingomonadaceae TaxID=41297 RepID=A0A1L4A062_9SPHN|nr:MULTISPECIES: tyrosine-type recombinase/integrase [Sphingomonadaceae]API61277.1 integrase [Tardibacter chloracetimidivorans]MBB4151248.1 site-specific recombinase XerD [Sphingobium scionense]
MASDDPSDTGNLPVTVPQPALPDILRAEVDRAADYAKASRSAATQRAYASDWDIFTAWCDVRGMESLPATPAAVATFLASEADSGLKVPTIGRRLAAIGYHHRQAGFDPPQEMAGASAIKEVLAGIRREVGTRPERKAPADADALRDMIRTIEGDDLRAVRDRAMLAIGMAAALRRSELAGLLIDDVELPPEGLRLLIGRSKTDQSGEGAVIAIPEGRRIRPKALLLAWIDAAMEAARNLNNPLITFESGPLFRRLTRGGELTADPVSDRAVARLVQRCAAAAGFDPTDYAGHSLRSGFLTEAARQGASIFKMRDVSRHKSVQVLADYVRDFEMFRDHAGEKFL